MEMNADYKRNLYERGRDRLATLLGMVGGKIHINMHIHTYIHTYILYIGYPEGGGKDAATLSLLTNYGNPLYLKHMCVN